LYRFSSFCQWWQSLQLFTFILSKVVAVGTAPANQSLNATGCHVHPC